MADSGTNPVRPNTFELEADVNVEFNEAASRQQINSGESVKTLFGKLRKFLTDLKAVAFSGAYSDLSGTPDLSQYASKSKYGDTTINVGRKADTVIGAYSTAEGRNATASGTYSHAEGNTTTASNAYCHAEGYSATASGESSHAEGYNTTASEQYSHAEGCRTTASGNSSHAEGYSTTASGSYSHTEGLNTTASGFASHAGGTGTKALHDNEVAYGKYNESKDDTVFSVGDGTSDSARHNAFEITATGGKLHDKNIATVDDIPTSLPADGGNADTVGGLRADEIANNPNLLINPDFKINQRGVSGTFSETGKYFVDRWRLVSGTVTVNADSTLTLNGTISQVFENAVGDNVTASVSAGTATYNDSTKTFSITANGETVSWAKLEHGGTATQFIPPDPTTELLKCKRYFEVINKACRALSPNDNWIEGMIFDVPKRIIPSISITSLAGTPNTLSTYTGADSTITLSGMPNVGFDRIYGSPCNQAIGHNAYSYICKADAEIY